MSLNEIGRKQAELNAEKLKNENIEYIFSSPLIRAVETAKICASKIGVNFEIIDSLSEFSTYDETCVGLTRDEITKKIECVDLGITSVDLEIIEKIKKEQGDSISVSSKDWVRANEDEALMDWKPLYGCETKREARNRILNAVLDICLKTNYKKIAISTHGTLLREFLRACNFKDKSKIKNCEAIRVKYIVLSNEIQIIERF